MDDVNSDASDLIHISSGEEDQAGEWESDYSTEKEVVTSPVLIVGRIMTT